MCPTMSAPQTSSRGGRILRMVSSAVRELVPAEVPASRGALRRVRRVAVVTDEAGLGAVALTALRRSAAGAPDLRQQTEMRIRHCADPSASVRDVVDLTSSCTATSLAATIDALADDPGCDAVLVALGSHDRSVRRTLVGTVERVSRDHPGTAVAVVCPSAPRPRSRTMVAPADRSL